MKSFKQFISEEEKSQLPILYDFVSPIDKESVKPLHEGRWVEKGVKKGSVRIDQPTHGIGQTHAHLYARNGDEYGVVNIDGTGSHKTKKNSRIQDDHADVLRGAGFSIGPDNLVEWQPFPEGAWLLLG